MNIAGIILHVVFSINILSLFIDFSQTVSRLILILVVLILLFLSVLQNKRYVRWNASELHANGFFFLIFYLFSIALGFFYGYDVKYVLVNLMILAPLLLFLALPNNINISKIYNIIIFYTFISVVFSFLEVFFSEKIGFIHSYIHASSEARLDNNIVGSLVKGNDIKAFGIFSNALQNGLFVLFGLIIMLFRLLDRFKWRYFVLILLCLPVLYWTYTRNVYYSLFAAVIFTFIISYSVAYKKSIRRLWWLTALFYFGVIISSFIYAGLDEFSGDSIQARIFSWEVIYRDYFFAKLTSFHVFVGYAMTQLSGDMAPERTYWAIDNSILMIFLSSGIIGIFMYLAWLRHIILLLCSRLRACKPYERLNIKILIVIVFVYIISGAMNANVLNIEFLLPLLLLMSGYARLSRNGS